MRILAFDTCLGAVSVAVRCGDALHEDSELRSMGQAERLVPMIAQVMQRAGLPFRDVERIAVTLGPGGFTGVRAGIAAARGLALALTKPVVGISSLAVMAHAARHQLGAALAGRLLAVAVAARHPLTYVQLFAGVEAATAPLALAPKEAASCIGGRCVVVVGSAAGAVADAVAAVGGKAETALPQLQPHARWLALCADQLAPLNPVMPLYLRPPDARPQRAFVLPLAMP
jgi:tRNA threonylcarbamoyladenosine biosynthesis protein TsaB